MMTSLPAEVARNFARDLLECIFSSDLSAKWQHASTVLIKISRASLCFFLPYHSWVIDGEDNWCSFQSAIDVISKLTSGICGNSKETRCLSW